VLISWASRRCKNKSLPHSIEKHCFGSVFLGKPAFKQTLDALKRQVLFGKSYIVLRAQADPIILQTAPTFFGLTLDGSLEMAHAILDAAGKSGRADDMTALALRLARTL
jgi:hypothetical protein